MGLFKKKQADRTVHAKKTPLSTKPSVPHGPAQPCGLSYLKFPRVGSSLLDDVGTPSRAELSRIAGESFTDRIGVK